MIRKSLKYLILGLASTAFITLALFLSNYSDYRPQSEVSFWLYSLKEVQKEIGDKILKSKSSNNVVVNIDFPKNIKNIETHSISKDGTIFLKGETFGQSITLKPEVSDDKMILWRCIGRPEKYMPLKCKNIKEDL